MVSYLLPLNIKEGADSVRLDLQSKELHICTVTDTLASAGVV
jgi:hypothetical protein